MLGEITVVLAGAVPTTDLPTLVAEVGALVAEGMRVKDACARVIEAHPGAPSRRELYDAVLRSRAGGWGYRPAQARGRAQRPGELTGV